MNASTKAPVRRCAALVAIAVMLMLPAELYAAIGSAESPIFALDAYRTFGEPSTGAGASSTFAINASRMNRAWADSGAFRIWNILGDVNDDCVVNILDMILVRNKLNEDPATDDNWKADINGDGAINILDLLGVRNELGARCE